LNEKADTHSALQSVLTFVETEWRHNRWCC